MITKNNIMMARDNWIEASKILDFRIITPFSIIIHGTNKEVFAFLPEYGSAKGTILELTSSPEFETDQEIIQWSRQNNCYYSFVNIESCLNFNLDFFKETLEDWMKY